MFYRLKEPYVFTGYKFLPFAIEAMDGENYFDKPLWQQLNDSYYREVAKTTVGDLVKSCEKCRDCEYLRRCYGGCMLTGMDESGNYLLPDENICRFFHSDYESRIREAADNVIRKYRK